MKISDVQKSFYQGSLFNQLKYAYKIVEPTSTTSCRPPLTLTPTLHNYTS